MAMSLRTYTTPLLTLTLTLVLVLLLLLHVVTPLLGHFHFGMVHPHSARDAAHWAFRHDADVSWQHMLPVRRCGWRAHGLAGHTCVHGVGCGFFVPLQSSHGGC